jgi:hypothetical protein
LKYLLMKDIDKNTRKKVKKLVKVKN